MTARQASRASFTDRCVSEASPIWDTARQLMVPSSSRGRPAFAARGPVVCRDCPESSGESGSPAHPITRYDSECSSVRPYSGPSNTVIPELPEYGDR
jgi:hypothetical protein